MGHHHGHVLEDYHSVRAQCTGALRRAAAASGAGKTRDLLKSFAEGMFDGNRREDEDFLPCLGGGN